MIKPPSLLSGRDGNEATREANCSGETCTPDGKVITIAPRVGVCTITTRMCGGFPYFLHTACVRYISKGASQTCVQSLIIALPIDSLIPCGKSHCNALNVRASNRTAHQRGHLPKRFAYSLIASRKRNTFLDANRFAKDSRNFDGGFKVQP